ncbi:MAG TPA: hypothetical protein VIH61_02160 [Waddliaceae bacterium]
MIVENELAIVLPRNPQTKDEMIRAIYVFASDKHGRVEQSDHIEWLEGKMKEIKTISKKLGGAKKVKDYV